MGLILTGSLIAQDLEDEGLKITSRGVDTISGDVSDEEVALDELVSTYDVAYISSTTNSSVDLVDAKRDQLSVVLRKAYYQKLTTPRWASVLAADSWRDSFLKWRYFAQLRNYIADLDSDLTYFKMTRPIAAATIPVVPSQQNTVQSSEEGVQQLIEQESLIAEIEEVLPEVVAGMPDDKVVPEEAEVTVALPISAKEEIAEDETTTPIALTATPVTTTEESWELSEAKAYTFTKSDLMLPDDILSEREIYEAELALRVDTVSGDNSVIAIALEDVGLDTQEDVTEEANKGNSLKATVKKEEVKKSPPKKEKKPVPKKETKTTTSPATQQSNQITSAPRIATTESSSSTPATTTTASAPEVKPVTKISAGRAAQTKGFERRRGSLSWPVMSGVVTDRFGLKEGAGANGLPARNNGIDMSCPPSTSILSVHSGMIMMVTPQGDENVVTVKHGDYVTAYYNIAEPTVKVGDVVAIGQRIGRLKRGANNVPFHFEVWRDQDRINPEQWLQPR